MIFRRRGQPKEAAKLYREALPVAKHDFGKESYEVAVCLEKLATALGQMSKVEEARENYNKAYKMMCRLLGESHPEARRVKSNMNTVMASLGAETINLEEHERRLADLKASLPASDPDESAARQKSIFVCLQTIAKEYRDRGMLEESKAKAEEGLELVRRWHPEKHADEAILLSLLADCHGKTGEWEEALKFTKKACRIYKKTMGPGNEEFLRCMGSAGACLEKLGKFDEAYETYEESLELCRANGQAKRSGQFLTSMEKCKFEMGDEEGCVELLKQATKADRENGVTDTGQTSERHLLLAMMEDALSGGG
mmetsp:Transcript_19398/g.44703  ORF Transcript_19398/g.44703 Transcript_19398/m.44703 type:complete len:311 (-) Transcript_19398:48-980(-)